MKDLSGLERRKGQSQINHGVTSMISAFRMTNKEIETFMERITRNASRSGGLIKSAEIEAMWRESGRFYSRRNCGRKRLTFRDSN